MTSLLKALDHAISAVQAEVLIVFPVGTSMHANGLQNLAQLKRLRAVLADGQEMLHARVGRPNASASPAAVAMMDLHYAIGRLLASYGIMFIDDAKPEHTILTICALNLLDTGTKRDAGMPTDVPELPAR